MNETEVVELVAILSQIAPAQKLDEYTADTWYELLDDISFGDARKAMTRVAKRQSFVAPADIRAEVKVIRRERLDKADSTFVYTGDPDDTAEYQRQLRAHIRAIGDGRQPPPSPALPRRVAPRMLEPVFRRPTADVLTRWPKADPPPAREPISEESLRQAREALADAAREAERTGRLIGAVEPFQGRP